MDKEWKIYWIVIVIVFSLIIIVSGQFICSIRTIVIEDKIVDVDLGNDNYMVITFSNGDIYHIKYPNSREGKLFDFTINSKLLIKLEKGDSWFFPNFDNVWTIKSIVKISEDGDC